MIERFTGAFAIALREAVQMHEEGHDRQAVVHMVAVAREILHATQVHIAECTQRGEIDVAHVIAAMRQRLDAAVSVVTGTAVRD